MKFLTTTTFLLTFGLAATVARAEWGSPTIGVRAAVLFNAEASFTSPADEILPFGTESGIDKQYDNGFVNVNKWGPSAPVTTNWGYTDAAQTPGDDTIRFNTTGGRMDGNLDGTTDDVQYGIEFFYEQPIGDNWGLKVVASYFRLEYENKVEGISGDALAIEDAYSLNGVDLLLFPSAPYAGTIEGPGPVIGTTASRTVMTTPGAIEMNTTRELDGSLTTVNGGPYYEIVVADRLALILHVGVTLALADVDFAYEEQLANRTASDVANSGESSNDEFLVGANAELTVVFGFAEGWTLEGGFRLQYLGDFSVEADGRTAEIDFGTAFVGTLGVAYSF